MIKNIGRILLIFFSVIFQLNNLVGQIEVEEEPKMLYWERTHRVKKWKDKQDFRDVFHKDKYLLGKKRIIGNISYNTGRVWVDDSQNNERRSEIRSSLGFYTRIRFYEEFSFNTTFFKNFNSEASARWISDYTYSIGRYTWKPNKFNYGYENYGNNKYSDNFKIFTERFLEGYYFLSYSHNLSKSLTDKIKLDSTTNVKFTYFARYAIKYRDEYNILHGGLFQGKPTIGAGIRLTLFWDIYAEAATYFYYKPSVQQQFWDPDYSYGFGYFNYRSFRCSLTYGNWVINRFPWNKSTRPEYGFLDGNFRFVINYVW